LSRRNRTCPRCGESYPSNTYAEHRLTPSHVAAVVTRKTIPKVSDLSESWAALEAAGTSRTEIAREAGVSRQYVSQVLLASGRRAHKPKQKTHPCFTCNEHYTTTWSEHQQEDEHQLRAKMLIERLETLSKGANP
jgi:DNA-directed RNA polymerase specialized sigma subunit